MIPDFELITHDVARIYLLTFFANKWLRLIDETCLTVLALVALVGVSPYIGAILTNLTTLWASAADAHLCCLVVFLIGDRKVQETA